MDCLHLSVCIFGVLCAVLPFFMLLEYVNIL